MKDQFPFPKLLAFLEKESDQVEFMKVCAEVGLGGTDMELAKLLLALQLYAAIYAKIPREIKAVHATALDEMHGLRDEVKSLVDRTANDTERIGAWTKEIINSLFAIQPKDVAEELNKRLLEETMANIGGSVQALGAAYGRIDAATAKLNAASARAEESIQGWQTITLRRVWMSAFGVCTVLTTAIGVLVWVLFSAR
jgi:hypothetical protein